MGDQPAALLRQSAFHAYVTNRWTFALWKGNFVKSKIEREKRIVETMIRSYCSGKHGGGGLCDSCSELLEYARLRLDSCPHGERKPFCSRCATHCYAKARREEIREVMRYSGPRMLWIMPLEFLRHGFGRR